MYNKIQRSVVSSSVSTRPRRQHCLSAHLLDSSITETTGSRVLYNGGSCEQFKIELYFPTLDHLSSEMDEWFNDQNLTLTNAIDALHPKSKQFLLMKF